MEDNKAASPKANSAQGHKIGLIDRADAGNSHQLQFWIESCGDGWFYLIRSAFMPGGKIVRSGVLDSGKVDTDYDRVRACGMEAFSKLKSK